LNQKIITKRIPTRLNPRPSPLPKKRRSRKQLSPQTRKTNIIPTKRRKKVASPNKKGTSLQKAMSSPTRRKNTLTKAAGRNKQKRKRQFRASKNISYNNPRARNLQNRLARI